MGYKYKNEIAHIVYKNLIKSNEKVLLLKNNGYYINKKYYKLNNNLNYEILNNILKNAKEYYQEKPFYINVPAKQIYDEDIKENILVQGIIDLYFVNESGQVVLVDYKTDYVENGNEFELVEKYKNQLDLYKQALENALGAKVDKVYIYSVYLDKEIEIK